MVLKVARGDSLPFKSVKFSGGFGKCFSFTKQVKTELKYVRRPQRLEVITDDFIPLMVYQVATNTF